MFQAASNGIFKGRQDRRLSTFGDGALVIESESVHRGGITQGVSLRKRARIRVTNDLDLH